MIPVRPHPQEPPLQSAVSAAVRRCSGAGGPRSLLRGPPTGRTSSWAPVQSSPQVSPAVRQHSVIAQCSLIQAGLQRVTKVASRGHLSRPGSPPQGWQPPRSPPLLLQPARVSGK
ncbi:hypothetical protein NDU88_002121 [Pleurodeles waltl]|uniref:Uncharacterized protein n=1 Tax=Pleurodeles waltl TaxID=8319 RepID=A0AAV7LZM1_PLEWA|nr:hypothetical protein NDU88_002121 [Pleurodeles waltl]